MYAIREKIVLGCLPLRGRLARRAKNPFSAVPGFAWAITPNQSVSEYISWSSPLTTVMMLGSSE